MAMEQPQGNGSTVLAIIAVGLISFGLGWFVGNQNTGTVDGATEVSQVADGDFQDSEILPVADSFTLGSDSATIKIVEFTSMQCPFCGRAAGTLAQLVEEYPGDVQLVFKHFPLSFQPLAEPGSRAVHAAGQQGQFWEMKALLFDNLRRYGSSESEFENLAVELAGELGLDVDQFRADYNDSATAAIVARDAELGASVGVRGTPAFFVNGELVTGAQPLDAFKEVVDRQLALVEELRGEGVAEGELYAAAVARNMDSGDSAPTAERAAPERAPQPATEVHMVEVHDNDSSKGASADEALVTILEFSSFQCPFCARGAETMRQLVERYPNQVRVVFKHFPLPNQTFSEPASRAAIAAGNQGKFWEMYDLNYENQRELGRDGIFEEFAGQLGLNMDRFRADFESAEAREIVQRSRREGSSAGITGTPGFLVNGIKVTGAQPLAVFENHVREQIEIAENIRDEQDLSGEALYAAVVAHNREAAGAAPAQRRVEREAPAPTVIEPDALTVGDSYFKGPADAPVTIYEFSSFQCPFCARGAETMAQILEEYDGQVRLVYKNFPLPNQRAAEPAARAALAAGEQDKFWEMYAAIYENQRRLTQEGIFEELAGQIGLNMDRFRTDFERQDLRDQVAAEAAEGRSVGVRGTPAFFVNGEMVSGAQPIENFRAIIDRHLE